MEEKKEWPKLDSEFKAKWVAALRSGKYKQTEGYLYECMDDGYCCLGVAGIICGYGADDLSGEDVFNNRPQWPLVPDMLIGSASDNDNDYNRLVRKLAHMNDTGYTFDEIADWIEENL